MYGPVTSDLASGAESAVGGDVEKDDKPKVKQTLEALLWYSFALIYSRIVFENEVRSNQSPPDSISAFPSWFWRSLRLTCKQWAAEAVVVKRICDQYNKSRSLIEKKSTFEDILSSLMRDFLRMPRDFPFFVCVCVSFHRIPLLLLQHLENRRCVVGWIRISR